MCDCIMRSCHGCTCTCHGPRAYGKQNPVRLHPASIVRTEIEPPKKRIVTKTVGGQHESGITLAELRALVEETKHLPEDQVAFVRSGVREINASNWTTPARRAYVKVTWEEDVR